MPNAIRSTLLVAAAVAASARASAQQPEVFAPGVISAEGTSETWITFMPDGRELYVSRHGGSFDRQTVFVSRLEADAWTVPRVAPFSGRFSDRAPRLSPDGQRLLFSSDRPVAGDSTRRWRLWLVERTVDGGWTEARPLGPAINGGQGDRHGVLSSDGSVYWASVGRAEGLGRSDIYSASPASSGQGYAPPVHLPAPINTPTSEPDLWVAPDGSYMILVVTDRPGGYGGDDLWISQRVGAVWTEPRNLGGRVNTVEYEYGPTLSPDGAWLYYASRDDIYRVRTSDLDVSQARALSLVDAALEAHGGADRLRGVRNMVIDVEGEIHWRHQSRVPTPPYDARAFAGFAVLDWERDRLVWENRWSMPGGFGGHNRLVSTATSTFNVAMGSGVVSEAARSGASAHAMNGRLPDRVLLRALEAPASLRWSGETHHRGRLHDVVGSRLGGETVELYIDRATRRLSKYALLRADEVGGDVVWEEIFEDYAVVDGLALPGRWRREIEALPTYDYRFRIRVDAPLSDSLFAPPAPVAAASPQRPDGTLSEVAPGVWFLEGAAPSYNMMFVELGESLVTLEAPAGSAVVERALERIRERVPGKPIRWAVATHHHDDHAGGMRALMAEGATIVAPPLSRAFYEGMARTRRTLAPDRLARQPVAARFETMQGDRHVLGGGARTVEVHRIGGPHADEMLVLYIPHAGILFQGDLMNAGGDLSLQPGNETTAHFAGWLARSGLRVERIYGVHSPARTTEDLARVVPGSPTR